MKKKRYCRVSSIFKNSVRTLYCTYLACLPACLPVLLVIPSQEIVFFNKSRTYLRQREATIFDILRLASATGNTVVLIVLFPRLMRRLQEAVLYL